MALPKNVWPVRFEIVEVLSTAPAPIPLDRLLARLGRRFPFLDPAALKAVLRTIPRAQAWYGDALRRDA